MSYKSFILARSGLAAYWPTEDISGPAILDATGNAINGISSGSYTLRNPGPFKNTYAWGGDGSTTQISFGTSALLNPLAITIEMWVYATNLTPAYSNIVFRTAAGTSTTFYIQQDGKVNAGVQGTGGFTGYNNGTATLTAGAWNLLHLTYDSVQGQIGYVNGVLDGTAAAVGPLSQASTPFIMGNDTGSAGRNLTGFLSNIAVYNRALTSTEAAATFAAQSLNNASSAMNVGGGVKFFGGTKNNVGDGVTF